MNMSDPSLTNHLSRENYRQFAKKAIRQYEKNNMLVDTLLWSEIIGYYEAELKEARRLAKAVCVDNWGKGDLAQAVRKLDEWRQQ